MRLTFFLAVFALVACTPEPKDLWDSGEEKSTSYAKGFEIYELGDGQFRLVLNNLELDSGILGEFLITPRDKEIPGTSHEVIQYPVERMACLSTTHIALIDKAGALQSLKGTAFASYVMNPEVKGLIESGDIADLSGSEDIDFEALVDLEPEVFLVYPFGDQDYNEYSNLGIKCFPISEYLENHPLGRAEWVKVIGLLTGKYQESVEAFNMIKAHYLETSNLVANMISHSESSNRPVVFTGSHSNGMWFAPPGNSFIARFLKDAGASYLFEDHESGNNVELQCEELFDIAYDADYWGKVIYEPGELTFEQIRANDQRYSQLKAFKTGQIFYCNTAESDYFGDGVMEPHIILEDLVSIFYPSLAMDSSFVYFRPITR
jgi:iron complex transport system substrate-binding protein